MIRTEVLAADNRQPGRPTVKAAVELASRMPRIQLEARRVAVSVIGVHGRRRSGPGETFWQFRALTPGESASRIDWRRSAREGKAYVREREWEASHSIWLWIDRSASMGFRSSLATASKIDRALVAGLALADVLVEAGERVGHIGLTHPISSRHVIERLSEAIVADAEGPGEPLPPAGALRSLAESVLITDALEPAELWRDRLNALAARGARGHLVLVVDPIEETFPFDGQAELFDLEDGLKLRIGDAAAWREQYVARLAAHREALRDAARKVGWSFSIHRTDRPASEIVLRTAALVAAGRGRS